MTMSRKQLIYLEILHNVLPYVRSIHTSPSWARDFSKTCLLEMELVHNLPVGLQEAAFIDHDIHFLNAQANWYLNNCNNTLSPLYDTNKRLIVELLNLVPYDLRDHVVLLGGTL